jgi:hypothetical protein
MPAFAPPPRAPGVAKTRLRAFAEGWTTEKQGEARARARRALRPASSEKETLVWNLADAAESFPSVEAADLNPLMERIRNRVREPLFPGPICRSNSTNTSGSTKLEVQRSFRTPIRGV